MMSTEQQPLYLQIIDKLKKDIEDEVYKAGEKLPSEYELSKQFNVSRATLRESLRQLEEEGVVIRRHGVGTFVHTKPLFTSGIEELYSVTDMINSANMKPGTIFLSSVFRDASEEDARRFQRNNLEKIMEMERVRTADGIPFVYCLDRIPSNLVEHYSIHEAKSLFRFLEENGHSIAYAITYIEPIGFHEKISELLESEPETTLLLLRQTHYDEMDTPLLYSLNYFRADKFKFHVVRRRMKA
nr:GntR family transcriptional regulator [Halalkalibacter urbisdiaboli]